MNTLALDASVRSKDVDGMLHVDVSNISKANVCPYKGSEIPKNDELGLNPEQLYYLYRDPNELNRAVDTFNGKPILNRHIPFNIDKPPKEFVVGAMGTDAAFDGTYLKNSLHFHDAAMIASIESGKQRQLSPGYRYRADMTAGSINGERYDGVMRDIACNHLAVVEVGRTGSDVIIFDELPQEMKMSEKLKKRLEALKPFLAQDADMEEVKKAITEDEEEEKKDKKEPDKASPAKDETSDKKKSEDGGKDKAEDEDEEDKKPMAKDSQINALKIAQDAAAKAEASVIARFQKIRKAENAVRPVVGEVAAMDSADEVYHFALDSIGVTSHKGLSGVALEVLFDEVSKAKASVKQTVIAQDSSARATLGDVITNLKGA